MVWLLGTLMLSSHEEAQKLGIPPADLALCEILSPSLPSSDAVLHLATEQLREAQAKSERLFELLKTQNRELQEARDKALQAAQVCG